MSKNTEEININSDDSKSDVEPIVVRWRCISKFPIRTDTDEHGYFDILIDEAIIVDVQIIGSKFGSKSGMKWNEYYIVTICDDGELEDLGQNRIGIECDSVIRWMPLNDILNT